MPQFLSENALNILSLIKREGKINSYSFIKKYFKNGSYRKIYTHIYQLEKRGYLEGYKHKDFEYLRLSPKGADALDSLKKVRDGKWKIMIYDIPEKQRAVRDFLRAKIQQLGFKRWHSVWITPYKIPDDVLHEIKLLGERYFIRLITVERINNDKGLYELFPK